VLFSEFQTMDEVQKPSNCDCHLQNPLELVYIWNCCRHIASFVLKVLVILYYTTSCNLTVSSVYTCIHQVETLFFAPCKLEPEGTRVCLARGFVSPFRPTPRFGTNHPDGRDKYYIATSTVAPTAGAYTPLSLPVCNAIYIKVVMLINWSYFIRENWRINRCTPYTIGMSLCQSVTQTLRPSCVLL
jgi:hypothetical protein